MQNDKSGLSYPIPKAEVAMTAFTAFDCQPRFDLGAHVGVVAARVRGDVEPAAGEELGETFRVGDRQRVHDPRTGQTIQRVSDPRPTLRVGEPRYDVETETGPGQAATDHDRARAELPGNVSGDTVVGGGSRRQDRHVIVEKCRRDPLVVGSEIVTPVGDAVRFVDNDQPDL